MADIKFSDVPLLAAATDTLHIPVVEGTTEGAITIPQLKTQILSAALPLVGGQIEFPATQVPSAGANTLDDYEEGTWTPSVGGNATYIAQLGTYTKIGRIVYVNCRLTINAIGTGSTRIISGLPFTASGSHPGSCSGFASLASSPVLLAPLIISGTTTIDMLSLTAGAASIGTNAIFGNSADVFVSGVYHV